MKDASIHRNFRLYSGAKNFLTGLTLLLIFQANASTSTELLSIDKAELIKKINSNEEIINRRIDAEALRSSIFEIASAPNTIESVNNENLKTPVKVSIKGSVIVRNLYLATPNCSDEKICGEIKDFSTLFRPLELLFDNVIFDGTNDGTSFTTKNKSTVFVGKDKTSMTLKINSNQLHGKVELYDVYLKPGSSFKHNTFNNDVTFFNSKFCDRCNIFGAAKTTNEPQVTIKNNNFNKPVLIINSEFDVHTDMSKNKFKSDFVLSHSYIRSTLSLNSNTFQGITRFNMINTPAIPYPWSWVNYERELSTIPTGSTLELRSSSFSETPIFQKVLIDKIIFKTLPVESITSPHLNESFQHLIAGKKTELSDGLTFIQSACNICDLSNIIVKGVVEFRHFAAGNILNFTASTFNDTIYLRGIITSKIMISDAKFNSRIFADWQAIFPVIIDTCSRDCTEQYLMLIDNFKQFDNLEAINELQYEIAAKDQSLSPLSGLIWGWGHRPSRAFFFGLLLFFIYTSLYLPQVPSSTKRRPVEDYVYRISIAAKFSYNCATKISFAWLNTSNYKFRIIACSESIVLKIIFVLFIISIAKSNPLISSIIGKIL